MKPSITAEEMETIINIRKVTSDEPSPETISMFIGSIEVITTPFSSRFLKGFKIIADKIKATKTKLDEESEEKSLLKKS